MIDTPNIIRGLTPTHWLCEGYRMFNQPKGLNSADYGLQKLFKDNVGKRYYLTVYVYENYKKSYYEQHKAYMNTWGYSPELQFQQKGKMTIDVQVLMDNKSTIEELEQQVHDIWVMLGCNYYEKW